MIVVHSSSQAKFKVQAHVLHGACLGNGRYFVVCGIRSRTSAGGTSATSDDHHWLGDHDVRQSLLVGSVTLKNGVDGMES